MTKQETKAQKTTKEQAKEAAAEIKAREEAVPKMVEFNTSKKVEFNINGKMFSGTHFIFGTEIASARKAMLREAYGPDIIKN